jgi:Zn-finger nucleic acid-binding protein
MSSRTVLCPMCDGAMQTQATHGVEIDLCPRCRGVWLDRGELDRILERSARFLEIPGDELGPTGHGLRRQDFFQRYRDSP